MEGNTEKQIQIASMLTCKVGEFPITSLGIPLRPTKLLHADWQPLFDKIDKRLAGWKGAIFSRAGRLVLVNSVLTAMPFYMMSFYHFPRWVRDMIDKIRSLFWKGGK